MSIRPGSNVASGKSMVVSPAAALISLDGAIWAILSPSITIAWFVFNSPVRTLSTRPARITVLFGAGACALAVIAVTASVATANAISTGRRRISRPALARVIKFFKTFIQAPRCELAFVTRGSIAKQRDSNLDRSRIRLSVLFLISDFPFLSLQFHDGDGFPAVLLSLKRMFLHQRMGSQKFANPLTKRAGPVSMNDPYSRLVRQRGVIQEFVQAVRGFFDGHADHVDFVRSAGFSALRRQRHARQPGRG